MVCIRLVCMFDKYHFFALPDMLILFSAVQFHSLAGGHPVEINLIQNDHREEA